MILLCLASWLDVSGEDLPREAPAPDFSRAADVLRGALQDRAFPGCAVAVGSSQRLLWCRGFGALDYKGGPPVTPRTLYDLASLTKVVGTTSVVLALVRDGKLAVNDPLARHLPEFLARAHDEEDRRRRSRVTIEHLLTHSAGLPAWKPFYRTTKSYGELLEAVLETPLEAAPGARTVYSDLGAILLGEAASRAGGRPLDELERSMVFQPLGLRETLRNPPAALRSRCAPTEIPPGARDGSPLQGVVHDENARAAGGLTGHAGLFSTARDVADFARELLRALRGESGIFPRKLVEGFARRRNLVPGSSRAMGWDTPADRGSAGDVLSRRSFGHTGFTGTSLWLDPDRDLYVILLSNRVHPSRENKKIYRVRRALADAVAQAVDRAKRRRRL